MVLPGGTTTLMVSESSTLLVVGEVMIDVATIDPAASVVRTSAVPKAVAKCASMPVISAAWTAASVVLKSPSKL